MAINHLSAAFGIPAASGISADSFVFPQPLIGQGAAMQRLRLQIERIGPHFRTVLVHGEIGTGKELVARALHARGCPPESPFVICHATRLAETSQTGQAMLERTGEGALFLDGMEEMPQEAQRQLIQMMEQRAGSRIIAATSQDLRGLSAAGSFRQDLYHRLSMVEIVIEPLRRRAEDIPLLAMHFLERFAEQYSKRIDGIAHDAMDRLMMHGWPGNVRELENTVHNGVLQCDGAVLGAADISSMTGLAEVPRAVETPQDAKAIRLQDVIERHVLRVLRECSGNKVRAAEMLGISRSTLYRMLEGCSDLKN